jgi:hypothetical protein
MIVQCQSPSGSNFDDGYVFASNNSDTGETFGGKIPNKPGTTVDYGSHAYVNHYTLSLLHIINGLVMFLI